MGVAKTEIVVGFHSAFKRQFTEYAVGYRSHKITMSSATSNAPVSMSLA